MPLVHHEAPVHGGKIWIDLSRLNGSFSERIEFLKRANNGPAPDALVLTTKYISKRLKWDHGSRAPGKPLCLTRRARNPKQPRKSKSRFLSGTHEPASQKIPAGGAGEKRMNLPFIANRGRDEVYSCPRIA